MPLGSRVLNVTLAMPNGNVLLDASLDVRVKIHKDALAIQNRCDILVFDLSQSLRQSLISQFTAWNKRNLEMGGQGQQQSYINVTVEAGYQNGSKTTSTTVFAGQIALAGPVGSIPNLGVQMTCYSQQLSKLAWITEYAPTQTTFKQYVEWAGKQMGVSSVVCETSYDNTPITNPSAATHTPYDLLIDIQNAYRPNVAAFIDNNILYVKDINKVISTAQIITVDEFINTPMWTEWGVEFECLFNPQLVLACGATLKSMMNPGLNSTFVVSSLDYDLTSRDVPFYVKANANPSA